MARPPKLPAAIKVGGDKYRATVLRVVDHDPDGSPRRLELLRDDESITVEGGEEFVIVFASRHLTARRE